MVSIKNNLKIMKDSSKRSKVKDHNITTEFMKSLFDTKERSNSRK